ncbi:tryptophan 2,3-dioxygenase family protein [Chitinophaga horti]|uniref:Tryptophan 2,3-dioxygenase family protein n=1 Tax=Chitinophaga horti TaxID=2920382 RepID=A0ABY6J183_9BACT|nr:tryptophan 2,3-dioxygenase family protein [Chitinophaga horti]UYQ91974.1 tryptophan 2,3-dioxygenase family protein [Chitinophaga horti]
MEITPEIKDRLLRLQEKYAAMGQDILAYLDGLLYADYLTYWDYIHLDTLLSLQQPKTSYPDEEIFIMYHQITELHFKLVLHECKQISQHPQLTPEFFATRLKRINAYFTALVSSFDIMVDGMDKDQFLKFRMALLPASGFQSGQYRMIEIYCTDMARLVTLSKREDLKGASLDEQFDNIYWKYGASELSTGKQTLTLQQFIAKYSGQLFKLAESVTLTNFSALYTRLKEQGDDLTVVEEELRKLDLFVNVEWPLSHYKSAVRYLERDPVDIAATGGTNWQKYLPPRFQKRIFFPALWTEEQMEQWGKSWVMNVLKAYRT